MQPNQSKLAELPGRGQDVTAMGTDTDCVSRSFFPKLLVPEDPVCGSAHLKKTFSKLFTVGNKKIIIATVNADEI